MPMRQGPRHGPEQKKRLKQGEEKIDVHKRRTLKHFAVVGAGAAGIMTVGAVLPVLRNGHHDRQETEPEPDDVPPPEEVPAPVEQEPVSEGPYATGVLAGRTLADLYAFYLGIPEGSIVPEYLPANFEEILGALWDKKEAFVLRREPGWIENTRRARERFMEAYRATRDSASARGTESLAVVNASFKPLLTEIHTSVNFEALNDIDDYARLTDEDVQLVKTLAGNITSEMLLAYSITELMPSVRDSELNVDVTEFLVRNAGTQFLAGIPAIHDKYLSAGMFQFTSHAIYNGPDGRRGASLINSLLPHSERIPDSVIDLTTPALQAKAAYLFAVENIARLIVSIRTGERSKTNARLATLRTNADHMRAGLLQYIASAHHNPSQARRGFKAWLDVGMRGKHSIHCRGAIRNYIIKTKGIYDVLIERFGS